MAFYTEEQFAKLPKWTQRLIRKLEADIADMEQRLGAGPEDSRVFAEPNSDTPRPLGNPPILFTWPHAENLGRVCAEVRLTPTGNLVISTNETMALTPMSSNVVQLRPISWEYLHATDAANEGKRRRQPQKTTG